MSRIVQTQGTLPTSHEEITEFMEGKRQMMAELKKQISLYYTVEGKYGSNLSPEKFVQEAVTIISDILGQHALIDRQIVKQAVSILEGLQKLKNNAEKKIYLADLNQYRQNYIESLELINRFVRKAGLQNKRESQ
jgi:hypothetical protein